MSESGGTYTLCIELAESVEIRVGALGPRCFKQGWYAYVGSARGTGGFARVDRHRELAAGQRETRHWHIDYLLSHPESGIERVVRTDGVDGECTVAETLDSPATEGFGCSDCDCQSHLFVGHGSLCAAVERAHASLPGETVVDQ